MRLGETGAAFPGNWCLEVLCQDRRLDNKQFCNIHPLPARPGGSLGLTHLVPLHEALKLSLAAPAVTCQSWGQAVTLSEIDQRR